MSWFTPEHLSTTLAYLTALSAILSVVGKFLPASWVVPREMISFITHLAPGNVADAWKALGNIFGKAGPAAAGVLLLVGASAGFVGATACGKYRNVIAPSSDFLDCLGQQAACGVTNAGIAILNCKGTADEATTVLFNDIVSAQRNGVGVGACADGGAP